MTTPIAPAELLAERGDPAARAVLEDWTLSHGGRPTRLGVAVDLLLHRTADAAADAAAAALRLLRNRNAELHGEIDMRDGLKIIKLPGGWRGTTFVGWVKRVAGDEYVLLPGHCWVHRTSGSRELSDLAADGPKSDHRVHEPARTEEEFNRFAVKRCKVADEKAWAKWCPRPKDWNES